MQPTIEILDRIRKNSRDNKEEIFTRLYRYLLRPDLYYLAYKNLYANKGAGTKGVNDDTADGFSKEKVDRIIQSLMEIIVHSQAGRLQGFGLGLVEELFVDYLHLCILLYF